MTTFTIKQNLDIAKKDFEDIYEAVYFLLQIDIKSRNQNSSYKNKKQIFAEAMDRYNNWNMIDWRWFLSNLISPKSNI